MTSRYDRYSKEELVRIIEDRDRKPRFGLVWERDDIEFDRSFNQDFVALDAISELLCGVGPWTTHQPCRWHMNPNIRLKNRDMLVP